MNEFVGNILRMHLPLILRADAVAVPDDEEEMNWRLFFAHGQDMQGFRADISTGGPNEAKHPSDPTFRGLRDRWSDSRSLIADLARLWDDPSIQAALWRMSHPFAPSEEKIKGVRPAIELLRQSGVPGAQAFVEILDSLHGDKIARKTNRMIRAYVQNSHLLAQHGCGYRAYLQCIIPSQPFPPDNVLTAEPEWVRAIERDFYNVGPALSNYMVADWLLWLWRDGQIEWFESYKPGAVHLRAIAEGRLEESAAGGFLAYCKTLSIPAGYGTLSGKPCPPRILNECIWLNLNRSSGQASAPDAAVTAPCPRCAICAGEMDPFFAVYPSAVCGRCDGRAVNAEGNPPSHPSTFDMGDNPVFIDGFTCWRRYRYGGFVTMRDLRHSGSIGEFYRLTGFVG